MGRSLVFLVAISVGAVLDGAGRPDGRLPVSRVRFLWRPGDSFGEPCVTMLNHGTP
jgi:hypothetical protein